MLLRHSLGLEIEATTIEAAVNHVLTNGPHTRDIGGKAGTAEIRDAVIAALDDVATPAFLCGLRACG